MDFQLLISNLTNPTLLFFVLGIFASRIKSDLEIPASSAKFISLYLLFSIGFNGGRELAHSHFTAEIGWSLLFGVAVSSLIPAYSFFVLKRRLGAENAGAIAASYGSVSAVTFVAAVSFLDTQQLTFGGHMVAVMALMESPAIIVGVVLMMMFGGGKHMPISQIVHHSVTNGSVLMILGSLVIGFIADEKMAVGITPFTTDIFKGFLAIFLLEMGMVTGTKLNSFFQNGWFATVFALVAPLVNGSLVAIASHAVASHSADRFMFAVLAASASYIAVPAAMRLAAPKADPGLYIPMALAVTFPLNITVGMPIYFMLAS
jgi:uncharacterized protein